MSVLECVSGLFLGCGSAFQDIISFHVACSGIAIPHTQPCPNEMIFWPVLFWVYGLFLCVCTVCDLLTRGIASLSPISSLSGTYVV